MADELQGFGATNGVMVRNLDYEVVYLPTSMDMRMHCRDNHEVMKRVDFATN